MTIESLQGLSTLVLALAAANERLVEAIKNIIPWLAKEQQATDQKAVTRDRHRQFVVQLLSFALASSIAAWVGDGRPWAWRFEYQVKTDTTGGDVLVVRAFMLGLMACGGSAFWNGILDFTRDAAKLRQKKTEILRQLNAQGPDALRNLTSRVQLDV